MPEPPPDDPTIDSAAATRPSSTPASDSATPSGNRYTPGTIVANRYRLVALLGRGGMGEVYRAEDLTLDQPVALKFLPESVVGDGQRLAQFHQELKLARQVAHKNVCRLYDLGDAHGRPFLTMEYIDGEDLASLIRRVGRIPEERAVELARQLCAGLAAAHDRGVLHRDLKPANVMLDGDGQIRITDFGLAMVEGDANADRSGTPRYMAPEQLSGQPASVRSDVYALGLVLYELFTGRPAWNAKTLGELVALHKDSTVATPSSLVRDLDPAIERVILRCLDRNPAARPASALAVAAALPGGDPLAAALAAGETPSPELVAAAGVTSAFNPAMGLALVAFVLAGIVAIAAWNDRTSLLSRAPFERPPDALEDRARDMVRAFGWGDGAAYEARGVTLDESYLRYVVRTDDGIGRWSSLDSAAFPGYTFWYRTSPTELAPGVSEWTPTIDDPPITGNGMTVVVLDTRGRLVRFRAVPPATANGAPTEAPPWDALFAAAELPKDAFNRVPPVWTPETYADERAAWEGPLPGAPDVQVRLEAAAYRGRPVSFRIIGPWTTSVGESSDAGPRAVFAVLNTLFILMVLILAVLLARANYLSKRGDRRGALRASAFIFGVLALEWVIGARHSLNIQREQYLLLNSFLPFSLTEAALFWLAYLAVEPYVRRYSPDLLFSWTRLVGGHIRDPRVGRDVLVGVSAGLVAALVRRSSFVLAPLTGRPPPMPRTSGVEFLLGGTHLIRTVLDAIPSALLDTAILLLAFVALRATLGRARWAGLVLVVLGMLLFGAPQGLGPAASAGVALVFTVVVIGTLIRFGLVSLLALFVVLTLATEAPLTLQFSALHAAAGTWTGATVLGLAVFGYWAARGNEPLLGHVAARD